MKKLLYILLLIVALLPNALQAQFDIPAKPSVQTSVYDYAKLLSDSDKKSLEQKLINYADTTTTQIVVAIIPTLKGEDIGLLTPRWGHEWGVGGSEQNDNGVMIVLARDERKIWISPGYGVEDRLTAGQVGEMTREVIIPYFKQGDYYGGLNAGTDAIIKMLHGKYKGERKQSNDDGGGIFGILFFIIILVVIFIIITKNGGGRGGRRRGGFDLADILILSSLGSSGGGRSSGGWGGGSSGGGGFGGGFGGGGFSGGGSGGSW